MILNIPADSWAAGLGFWEASTGWTADQSSATLHGDRILGGTGGSWLTLERTGEVPGVRLRVEGRHAALMIPRAVDCGATWAPDDISLLSPGGFPFRVVQRVGSHVVPRGGQAVLDQACLDIPADLFDDECAFWTSLTGRDLEHGGHPEFAFLGGDPEHASLRLLLQRLDDAAPSVTAHPEFAVADRRAEVDRHRAFGAEDVETFKSWTVMRAPDGRLYCLTDRGPVTSRVRR